MFFLRFSCKIVTKNMNVPGHILAPSAVASATFSYRASAHLRGSLFAL